MCIKYPQLNIPSMLIHDDLLWKRLVPTRAISATTTSLCHWQRDPWFLTVSSAVHLHQPGYISRTLGRLPSTLWKHTKLNSVFAGHVSLCVTFPVHRTITVIIISYLLFTSWHCCCGLYKYYPTSSKCILSSQVSGKYFYCHSLAHILSG